MRRLFQMLFAVIAYALFLVVFLYAIAFVGDLAVPKTIDSGPLGPWPEAAIVDVLLLGLFAIQHSGMARAGFKRVWTRVAPVGIERSVYVLASSLALALLFWAWRPMPAVVWSTSGTAAGILWALFALGWAIVLLSTFMLSHFELFGLSQAWASFRDRPVEDIPFRSPMLYGLVRHPIMLGFIIAFWAAPEMTAGRLFFAAMSTGYILIALQLEEADLLARFGEAYAAYRRRTPMLIPFAPARRAEPVSRPAIKG